MQCGSDGEEGIVRLDGKIGSRTVCEAIVEVVVGSDVVPIMSLSLYRI